MDGPPPQEEDFSALSVPDRLVHKNWKARVSAYESLIKSFQTSASDNDPVFKPYVNNPDLLRKIATDSNAVAQEKGIECLISLVKFAGETAAKSRETVLVALVDKCLGSTRAGTKVNALELILQYVEVENGGAGVVENVLPGLSSKQPKTVAGCVLALKELVRSFGLQVIPPPPILKALPKIFSHSDKTVRAEGAALTHVLYQYLGPSIESWLADLKPVQVKELKETFESMESEGKGKGTVKPERMTRVQTREAEAHVEGSGAVQEEAAPVEDLDPRAFAEEVDIVPRIPSEFHANLKSSQWKQRKEALDDLSTLLSSTPRIKEAVELGELAKALATCIAKDANINCVMVAASCLEEMAKGMMHGFGKYRELAVPLMLERLKERKTNVTDSIGNALDAIFHTTTLPAILSDLEPALKSKNPQVKEGTLKFLCRCLSTSTTPVPPPQIKPLAEDLATLLEDGFEGARNEAAASFGTLMKMVGERPLNAVMESMADIRKAKVKEAFEKATVKCKAGSAPPRAPTAPVPAAKKAVPIKASSAKPTEPKVADDNPPIPKKQSEIEKLDRDLPKGPPGKPPARLLAKKGATPGASGTAGPVVKKPPAATGSKAKPPPPPAASGLDTFKYKHTPEDAESLWAELIPANIAIDLADANWKTRLAALEEMTSWVEREVNALDAEVVIRFLAKKGWAEKNFQVSTKIYGILSILAQQNPSFGRSCCALCVSHLTEKLGDMKLKRPAGDTLIIFAEKTSLQFVLSQAYDPLGKQKAPKVLADALTWINTALTEFGIAGLSLRNFIEFLKVTLGNSNAAVRTSATKVLVTVKMFAGPSIKDLLEDLNPQLLSTIVSEFDKVEGMLAPEPTRMSADLADFTAAPGGSGKIAGGADPLDDIFPRVELDSLLKGTTILAGAKSDAWKTKKEALENLQAILDQGTNKRLKPSMGEIGQVLKARVLDTNKAVQALALDITSRIATGMGKPFEKHSRLFVAPVTTVLADQKAPVRTAALHVLTAIAMACGVEFMVAGISTGLETQNPLQKSTLLHWLADWFKEHEPSTSLDITSWAAPIVASLDDRNGDVRKGAQAVLPILIRCIGFDPVMQQTNALKPASRATAVPLIQAARLVDVELAASAPVPPVKTTLKVAPPQNLSGSPPSEPASNPAPTAPVPKVASKIGGIRRKLPTTTTSRPESRTESLADSKPSAGVKRPTAISSSPEQPQPAVLPSIPFTSNNLDAKRLRLTKDGQRWINEGGPTRKDLAELLQAQMEPHASKELVTRLFSHDHNAVNDFVAGQSMFVDFYSNASGDENVEAVCLANLDFPLKYVSLRVQEAQSNLVSKCLDVVEAILDFLRNINYQMTEGEALCFVPTLVHKLGDAREPVRVRVQRIFQALPKVYPYSRVFQLLLDQGIKAKVAKTRQGTLDELANILKKSGMNACEPAKAFPLIASLISDKDPQVRKSALNVLSEAYTLVGEKVWSLVGTLSPKDKTQLEERLRRTPGPSSHDKLESTAPNPVVSRLAGGLPRPTSPSAAATSRIARPASPATFRAVSPAPASRAESPIRGPRPTAQSPVPASPSARGHGKSMLPSRLGRPRSNFPTISTNVLREPLHQEPAQPSPPTAYQELPATQRLGNYDLMTPTEGPEDITLTISTILSSDPSRSVDALKKIQKILSAGPEAGPSNPQYHELAEHTEGLIESVTLQMAHIFERPEELVADENFRLAKHLIQTLNNFCDHGVLAESLTVDILTSLLEELTLRLLETDDSSVKKIKDLSRFINMIILRLFATGRRMSIFRALFSLLLQIVKPFPSHGTLPESKEAKVAELVLKCVWKLARNIPQDLAEMQLDPVELFPAIEHFLQSVPPNEWRARATNKVPCGDMPLRTIKVIIQHVVGHYGDDVYDLLSASFDDPSATIVYPYVYRILNSGTSRISEAPNRRNGHGTEPPTRLLSPVSSRPISPQESVSSRPRTSHNTSPSSSSVGNNAFSPTAEEPDPEAQLLTIIGHISSETTGALHKEGVTELHHFLKAHPHKRPRVEKMLESTGAAFQKYINRALASRAAEDKEREVAVANTLSKLEYNSREPVRAAPSVEASPRRANSIVENTDQEKLSRLHDIFQYRSSTLSNGSSQGRTTPTTQRTSLDP